MSRTAVGAAAPRPPRRTTSVDIARRALSALAGLERAHREAEQRGVPAEVAKAMVGRTAREIVSVVRGVRP